MLAGAVAPPANWADAAGAYAATPASSAAATLESSILCRLMISPTDYEPWLPDPTSLRARFTNVIQHDRNVRRIFVGPRTA